jgi:hypothetical protein
MGQFDVDENHARHVSRVLAQQAATNEPFIGVAIDKSENKDYYFIKQLGSGASGKVFTASIVARIQDRYRLRPRYDRLRQAGLLTGEEMATLLGISRSQVKVWRQHGLLRGQAYTAKPDWLYEHPGNHPPRKAQGVKLSQQRLIPEVMPEEAKEVQCEA